MIDLRSDTLTVPTQGMRDAMYRAEVGDDVFDEDPTVRVLQERVAELLGKEAALFVPSGTMANLTSIMTLCRPGTEAITEQGSHVYNFEQGSAARYAGIQFRLITSRNGWFRAGDVEPLIRPDDLHYPPTSLVCIENTHNKAGGTIFPIEEMENVALLARDRGIPIHLDGARLWNASMASGIPLDRYAACADTISVCLSKGLGAPVGSLVAGARKVIESARRVRKSLGGGMRQVGILAAAGIYAIENNRERLREDHKHARILAEALADLSEIDIDPGGVETNIVIADVKRHPMSDEEILARLAEKGVLVLTIGARRLRLVTHLDVADHQVREAAGILRDVLS